MSRTAAATSASSGSPASSGAPASHGAPAGSATPANPDTPSMTGSSPIRHDWSRREIAALFDLPFPELMFRAQSVHRLFFHPTEVQISTLLSIKTGGCPEDCAYCPQSARYD